jgi:hypothetical protein
MSTELNSINGRVETLGGGWDFETVYKPAKMSLTRFSGGQDEGVMLQITIPNLHNEPFVHMQFNELQIQEMVDELRKHFNIK